MILITDPKAFLIGWAVFILLAVVWVALDHFIFSPRQVKKIVAEIRKEIAQREQSVR